jgi:hypothetical protein
MSYRKFGKNDVLINTLKAHPKSEFFIYSGTVYYNNRARQVVTLNSGFQSSSASPGNVLMTPPGYVNLYEYNIDRLTGSNGKPNPLIYPFIIKDGSRASFSIDGTETSADFATAEYGDLITGSYPQSASISRQFLDGNQSGSNDALIAHRLCHGAYSHYKTCGHNMNYWSLRTILNHYGTMSPHYLVSSSYNEEVGGRGGWDKDTQEMALIHIPSIFYGSEIRKGTVSLQWYVTGTLIGELKDERENGELIQTGPKRQSLGSGSVGGVVLYNEGFILLTGSWRIDGGKTIDLDDESRNPRWKYWGYGIRQDMDGTSIHGGNTFLSASFGLSFEGVTKTDVLTMYARAPKGKVNYSNNPTFIKHGQQQLAFTSSHVYEENKNRLIKNTVSSSYTKHDEDFKRQVYISKVAVYDDNKQLIGVATLSNPVLKKEEEDLAVKIKLDI